MIPPLPGPAAAGLDDSASILPAAAAAGSIEHEILCRRACVSAYPAIFRHIQPYCRRGGADYAWIYANCRQRAAIADGRMVGW